MVQNSITIKAETIEEAVQTALNILQCSTDDINVQVVQPPSKSLFGLRKRLAEVSITKVNSPAVLTETTSGQEKSAIAFQNRELDKLIEEVMDDDIPNWEQEKVITQILLKKKIKR